MTKLGGLGSLLLIALAPAAAVADDYQFEARGGFDHLGSDTDIDVATEHPEFRAQRWIMPAQFRIEWLPEMKREVYRAVFADFFGLKM